MPESIEAVEKNEEDVDFEKMESRAQALARSIGNDQEMSVKVKPHQKQTHWNWAKNEVIIAGDVARRATEETLGAISHEGMHRRISRGFFIPEEIRQDQGFNGLMQTMEDVRVNTALTQMYPGAGEWVREVYQAILSENDQTTELNRAFAEAEGSFGYLPYQLEFCAQVQKKWAFGEYDPEETISAPVKAALRELHEELEEVRLNIPQMDATEEEIVESAKDGYVTLRRKIWPKFERLVQRDIENEQIRQYLLKAKQDASGRIQDELLETLTEEQLDEFISVMDRAAEQGSLEEPQNEKFNLGDFRSMSKGLRKKLLRAAAKEQKENPEDENQGEQGEGEDSSSGNQPKTAEDKAREALKKIEDDLVRALRPKMSDPKENQTHEESEGGSKGEEIEKAAEKAKRKAKEEAERFKSTYDEAYQEMAELIEELAYELEEILYPNKTTRWKAGYPTGSRASLAKVMEFEADPRKYNRLFERKTLPEVRDYKFTLLVDMSGSMYMGERYREAMKATVLFAEVLDRIGIDFEIIGFNTFPTTERAREEYVFKAFSKPFDREAKERTQRISEDITNSRDETGYNDDGPALNWAAKRLINETGTQKFAFVISDGAPAYSPRYTDPDMEIDTEEEGDIALANVVQRVMEQSINLIGLGIGSSGVSAVRRYYPNNRIVPDAHALGGIMGELIMDIIANPAKYQR